MFDPIVSTITSSEFVNGTYALCCMYVHKYIYMYIHMFYLYSIFSCTYISMCVFACLSSVRIHPFFAF